MPKSLLEAMSCGLACIATDVKGSQELIIDGETGLLARSCEAVELKEQILKLKSNPSLQNLLGKNSRRFVTKNYNLGSLIEREIKIYKKLL